MEDFDIFIGKVQKVKDSVNFPLVIFFNKMDLENHEIKEKYIEEIMEKAKNRVSKDIKYFIESAKTRNNVDIKSFMKLTKKFH